MQDFYASLQERYMVILEPTPRFAPKPTVPIRPSVHPAPPIVFTLDALERPALPQTALDVLHPIKQPLGRRVERHDLWIGRAEQVEQEQKVDACESGREGVGRLAVRWEVRFGPFFG